MSTYGVYPTAEQEKAVKEFLESLNVSFETEDENEELPQHVIDGIQRGLDDAAAGRTISYDEFKKKHLHASKSSVYHPERQRTML